MTEMETVKVIVIHTGISGGGIANASVSHAHGLISAGVPTQLWTASPKAAQLAKTLDVPVVLHPAIAEPWYPFLRSELWQQRNAAQSAKAILHQGSKSRAWAWAMWPRAVHAVRFPNRKIRTKRLYKNWMAMSTRHADSLLAERTLGLFRHNVAIVRNGAAQMAACKLTTKRTFRSDNRFVVGALGELCHRKGQDLLLTALKKLRDRGIDAHVRLGGEGKTKDQLKSQVESLGLCDHVEILGWVEATEFLASLDVFCLPSRHEPFGVVVVEALAMGLPVIASDTYGPANILEDGSGIIVPVDDAQALAVALEELANDHPRALQLANAAAARARDAFSPAAVGQQLIAAYRKFGVDLAQR